MSKIRILIAGEGGQGIQTIAKILSKSMFMSGKECSYIPSFGVEQRGAPSIAYVTIGPESCNFDIADVVLILASRAVKKVAHFVTPNTSVIFDSSTISKSELPKNTYKYFGAPITQYANEKFTNKSLNLIALAILSNFLGLHGKSIWMGAASLLKEKLKDKEAFNVSKEAFEFGYDIVLEKDTYSKPLYGTFTKCLIFKGHGKIGQVLPKQCKGCGICILKCPVGALKFGEELGVFSTSVPKIDTEKCIACQNCRNFCPDGAIAVEKDGR